MRTKTLAATAALVLVAACDMQGADPAANRADATAATENAAVVAADGNAALGPPIGREQALKLMHDRHERMEDIGDQVKALNRTLKSSRPDLAVIRSSAGTIARLAPLIPSWFPAGTGPDVGKTYAKAEVWEKPEDFVAKANAFENAARAFDAAAKSGDLSAIRSRFADLGKSCKACHDLYREEHDH